MLIDTDPSKSTSRTLQTQNTRSGFDQRVIEGSRSSLQVSSDRRISNTTDGPAFEQPVVGVAQRLPMVKVPLRLLLRVLLLSPP